MYETRVLRARRLQSGTLALQLADGDPGADRKALSAAGVGSERQLLGGLTEACLDQAPKLFKCDGPIK